MNQCEYIYGVSEPQWQNLSLHESIEIQNHLGEELLDELFVAYYEERDIKRINAVIRHIKKNIQLLHTL